MYDLTRLKLTKYSTLRTFGILYSMCRMSVFQHGTRQGLTLSLASRHWGQLGYGISKSLIPSTIASEIYRPIVISLPLNFPSSIPVIVALASPYTLQ